MPTPAAAAARRAGWVVASVVGLLVLAVVAAVLVARPEVQVGSAPRAIGQRPAAKLPPDPRTDLPKLLAKRAEAIVDDDRAAFLATVDKRQKAVLQVSRRPCSPGCGRCRSRASPTASTAPCVPAGR